MANWIKIEVLFEDRGESERNSMLGIEGEARTMSKDIYLDLDEIQFFSEVLDENGDPEPDRTMLYLKGGPMLSAYISPENLHKKLTNGKV